VTSIPISDHREIRLPRGVAAVAAIVLAICLGTFCGRLAVSHYGKSAIEALILGPILWAIAKRPLIAVIALLSVVATLFHYGALPRVNLPGHPPINVADLFLAATVVGTLWRRPWVTWPKPARHYFLAIGLLLILSSIATIKTALVDAEHAREALLAYRNFLYLGVALTIAIELRENQWQRLLNGLIILTSVIAALSVGAAASSGISHLLTSLTPWSVSDASQTAAAGGGGPLGNTARIRVEGLYLVYAMVIPTLALALFVKDRWRKLRIVAVLLMLGAIGVSLNRNMYAGLLVGLLITGVLGGTKLRARLGLLAVAAVTTIVLIAATSVAPAISTQIGNRASTLISPSTVLKSGSLTDRSYELQYAIPSIGRHPWIGVGPSQFYGAYNSPFSSIPRLFVQNLYVDWAVDYGIPTALAFLLIPGVCMAYGLRRLRLARDPADRALLAALLGTIVALLLSLFVGTYLQGPESTTAFGVACGLLLAVTMRTTDSLRAWQPAGAELPPSPSPEPAPASAG
jgi:O-antigen ligase